MQLKIIKNEKEYDKVLNRIDELMELNPDLVPYIGNKSKVSQLLNRKVS